MILRHVGLTCSSEENADTFYADLLGLTKSEPKLLSRELVKAIFNLDSELAMVNYQNEDIHFEVFITAQIINKTNRIDHTCLEIADLEGFLEKCRRLNVEVARIPRGEKMLIFIRDFDGNLFELKNV